jgi:hypothetical protein
MYFYFNSKRYCFGAIEQDTRDVFKGAAVGGASGAVRGLAKCTPAAFGGPYPYAGCVVNEVVVGATVGATAVATTKALGKN